MPSGAISSLVFASGAVGTASALGQVFARPLQAKETVPCSPLNCPQLRDDPQHPSLHQQAQCPSHIFQQQCNVHKRFRLFRQKPRRCQIHTSPSVGPNYILPPTIIHPLVVRPDKILLEHYEEPAPSTNMESWRQTITTSESMSSRLSSYSTVSLSLSTGSYNQGSDSESYISNPFRSPRKKKIKEQKPQPRCLCYLNSPTTDAPGPFLSSSSGSRPGTLQPPLLSPSSWYPQKHQLKEASRLRRIWNDSTIFHWSKPSGLNRRWVQDPDQDQDQDRPPEDMREPPLQPTTAETSMEHTRQPSPADQMGVPMRLSMSGTDFSEGNQSFSDVDDDDDLRRTTEGSQRVSFQDYSHHHHHGSRHGTGGGSSSRAAKESMKAIARQQAVASLEGYKDYEAYQTGNQALRTNRQQQQQQQQHVQVHASEIVRPHAQAFIQTDDEDDRLRNSDDEGEDEDEDWDIQSDNGAPSSSPMYSAETQRPTSYSTVTLPLTATGGGSSSMSPKTYHKKQSSSALNSLRGRQRCMSLPAENLPPGFSKMSSAPSENWDEDFDIGSSDINVPSQVAESQVSLQMDIYNIKDFASQIEDLKNLRASLRLASSSLKARNPKKHQDLSELFQRDWEQAEVIIDLGEIAQTSTTMAATTATTPVSPTGSKSISGQRQQQPSHMSALAAGPLSLVSGKAHQAEALATKESRSRRPDLSTVTVPSAPSSPPNQEQQQLVHVQSAAPTAIPIRTTSLTAQSRTLSPSSSLTGTTLAGSMDEDGCITAVEEEETPRQQNKHRSLKIDIEAAVEGTAIGRFPNPLSPKTWRRKPETTTVPKENQSSSAGLSGRSASPVTPLPVGFQSPPRPTLPTKGFNGGYGTPEEMNASFRRYQKYRHRHSYNHEPTAAAPSNGARYARTSRHGNIDDGDDDDDDHEDDEDDDYQSYSRRQPSSSSTGGGLSPSVGVISPIPSDRHMQVLKDILMEGLGSDVARQYMFKHGEQDHVRFSVEVIPGLLGHLKGLQRRLGDQLLELQQLTVIV
ncbi:hypothetical protein EMPS_00430 [Entomortierella parvispora]|uniref:Uncharacterized protein n=1 Tax=Entomortierella parvispora TaxID=205924 RepID=A0A9P3H0W4_9FUNG|nr:hypothetical protein EMPS_00430 [Entomortierella parvispora]